MSRWIDRDACQVIVADTDWTYEILESYDLIESVER